MKNQIQQFAVITFFILFFSMANSGCKNKDCHKDGTCAPDYRWMPLGEAKSYLYALPGSYWIYQNTATGDLDTQICYSFHLDTVVAKGTYNDTKHITIEYERISRTIESSFGNREFYDETAGYNANVPRDLKAIVARHAYGFEISALFYPFIINEINGTGSSVTTLKVVDTNLILQGKTYNNVAQFEVDADDIWYGTLNYPNTVYYWAKDVGLIKMKNKTENYSWELIEYNIVK